jgi:DNA repair photolyase
MTKLDIREVSARTILTRCGIPGIDYVINPYTGCAFGCTYCYASFMSRFIPGKTIADWGTYVFAKINAPQLLKKEIGRLPQKGQGKEIFFSSVTDPYQGLEAKYQLTRQCLQILADSKTEASISILTKSHLVTRDIDIFKQLKSVFVGLTVTSTNDSISRYFERYASNVTDRLEALRELNKNNIPTYAFIGPLLPHFVAQTDQLEQIFKRLKETGTKNLFVEHLNLSMYIRNRLLKEMPDADPKILDTFYLSQAKNYRNQLDKIVLSFVKKYDMHLMHDQTIFHKEFQKSHESRSINHLHNR